MIMKSIFTIQKINIIPYFKRLTLEKHAPMCTFGVGGNPLLGGLGGVCLRRCFRGGTGGQATKSGAFESLLLSVSVARIQLYFN